MYNYKLLDPAQCEFVAVGKEEEVPNGERLFVDIDEYAIVVFNIAGQYFAIGDVCSHDDGPVGEGALMGYEVVCPRHGARFDLRSGKVLSLPAFVDIPAYPVRVVEGVIEVGVPLNDPV
jgi:3-phenylpropionate/trans-cinnamate dioxygenase ferredoxin subunit